MPDDAPRYVHVGADQQIRVTAAEWPATPITVDAQHSTAWLRREIVFDREPLERVAAEFNRYAPKPIEIAAPALQNLQVSGAFATDDSAAFIAFLRTLKGVRVEVTAEHGFGCHSSRRCCATPYDPRVHYAKLHLRARRDA